MSLGRYKIEKCSKLKQKYQKYFVLRHSPHELKITKNAALQKL